MPSIEDDRLRDLLLACLDGLPVRVRGMFGGYGLYMEDVFFGIISAGSGIYRKNRVAPVIRTR